MSKLERFAGRSARSLAALALGILLCFSCSPGTEPQEGSETHFLKWCDGGCAAPSTCVCGVCTTSCEAATDCDGHGAQVSCVSLAPRVAELRCDPSAAATICDSECVEAADCAWLGAGFGCENGYCRQGTSPTPGPTGGTCAPSSLLPEDVVVLGDVLIELSPFFADLEQQASDAGKLVAGAHYRNYAASATSFLAEGPASISTQYAKARAERAARVIVMNGGATDMLNDACASDMTSNCPAVRAAIRGAEQLFAGFAADGVEHVVYFFYPDALNNQSLKAGIDILRPLVQNVCGKSRVACHWLDLRTVFTGHPDYLVGADGIVFGEAGAKVAAASVFELMSDRCVAQ
jgi:hypothetical protein